MKQGESSVGRGGGSQRGVMDKGSDEGFLPVGEGAVRTHNAGFFNPGRMAGAGIGSLIGGPIGGLLGGFIGGGGLRGWGYEDAQGNRVSAFRDMFDGGGRGRFGDTFEGGLLSNVANRVGIRPAGYRARQAAMGQQQPDYVGGMAAPVAGGGVVPTSGGASPSAVPADIATAYEPIDLAGPVRNIPIPEPSLPPITSMPSAVERYFDMYGMPYGMPYRHGVPFPSETLPNPSLLPRATPSLSALEAYVASNPMRMNASPEMVGAAPVAMPGRSDPLVYPLFGQRIGSPDINLRSNRFAPRMPTPPRDPNPYASTFPPGLLRR